METMPPTCTSCQRNLTQKAIVHEEYVQVVPIIPRDCTPLSNKKTTIKLGIRKDPLGGMSRDGLAI
jgi:hypothetical protein